MEHNIGFIGLGAMGYGMAKNVRQRMDRNATLYVNDVNRAACEAFKAEFSSLGAIEIAESARLVAEHALRVVSIVPSAEHVRDVYLNGETGVVAAKGRDSAAQPLDFMRLYLECSTIDVASAREIGTALQQAGMGTYVDGPVSGGVPAAQTGTLSMMLGAAEPKEEQGQVAEGLATLCGYMASNPSKIFYCGGLGKGLAAKICNNYLSCTILLANCEAAATGQLLGLDKHLLYKIIKSSSGQNFMADHVYPVPGVVPHAPSSNGYKLGFKTQMLTKDVGLGVDAARSVGVTPSIGEAALDVYRKAAVDPSCIDRDGSIVYRFMGGPVD
ncbi:putative 3-hydroxyisobutyrate dehydrogenase [Microdochium bolleyi]|uniref:3-hydroxyisobutyrate dehydrogenase n=1 Tax=Microdochium bolleyi TaxID=196109 RepID=A0A136ISB4_9PEZI|nr:putative 3-hydroxyisobutyrate dehydrogenase [Microdochium bolleyi]